MRTIGRPLYKTIGRVVGKGAHLGSKLNLLLLFDAEGVALYDSNGVRLTHL